MRTHITILSRLITKTEQCCSCLPSDSQNEMDTDVKFTVKLTLWTLIIMTDDYRFSTVNVLVLCLSFSILLTLDTPWFNRRTDFHFMAINVSHYRTEPTLYSYSRYVIITL